MTDFATRFVLFMLRGGLDGLSAVIPTGDPHLLPLRRDLVADEGWTLDSLFSLHAALEGIAALYQAGQALVMHAVAGPYTSRSHFEAQDLMECGASRRLRSGWLNRVAGCLPRENRRTVALGIARQAPIVLRGPNPAGTLMPVGGATSDAEFFARVLAIHGCDELTGPALRAGLGDRQFAAKTLAGMPPVHDVADTPALAERAGRLLAAEDGPRLVTIEMDGWDTHVGQASRLDFRLRELDDSLTALRRGLGETWWRTAVLVITEFGRAARSNGNGGTDHGTGYAAMLLGGAVAGGRVMADWPGLGPRDLLDGRDLAPSIELQAVLKGVLGDHLGLTAAQLADVFPDSDRVRPLRYLIAA